MKTELGKIKKDIAWLIGQIKCLLSIFPVATTWSNNHSATTGNKYLKDTLVWDNGFIYKCLVDNNSNPTNNSFYWEKVGRGWLLQQEQADWNATEGPSFIRNKPTSIGGGTEEDPIFQAWLATNPLASFITEENDPVFVAWLATNPLDEYLTVETDPLFSSWLDSNPLSPYLTSLTAAATYQPIGSYLTSISGLNISLLNNDSGYITSSSLTPYLTISSASTTYFPIPTGSTSQYIRGDGSLATFPTFTNGLPTGGTAGQILTKVDATDYNATWQDNYADWTSVVKHTVKNNGASGTITKGTAVYVTGADGTNMLVGRASNVSEATSSKTMGLMQSDITTTGGTQTGFVITEGLLGGLNTAGQTAGDPVWLGVNGALIYGLINKPYAPAHLVFIGIVTKVSAGSGEIFVKVQNGFELNEIHDVDLKSNLPTNNQLLAYESATSLWKNKSLEELGSTTNLISDGLPGTPITGGTSLTRSLIKSYSVPANTFAAGDTLEVWVIGSKVNINSSWYVSVSVNTTNTLVGAPEISRSNGTAAVTYLPLQRIYNFTTSTNLRGAISNSNTVLEGNLVGTSVTNTTFNTAVDNWILISVYPLTGGTADIMNIEKVIIRKNKYKVTV